MSETMNSVLARRTKMLHRVATRQQFMSSSALSNFELEMKSQEIANELYKLHHINGGSNAKEVKDLLKSISEAVGKAPKNTISAQALQNGINTLNDNFSSSQKGAIKELLSVLEKRIGDAKKN